MRFYCLNTCLEIIHDHHFDTICIISNKVKQLVTDIWFFAYFVFKKGSPKSLLKYFSLILMRTTNIEAKQESPNHE